MKKYMYVGYEHENYWSTKESAFGGVYYGEPWHDKLNLFYCHSGEYFVTVGLNEVVKETKPTRLARKMFPNAINHFGSMFILEGR
jgi:hypothetical protein